MSNPSFQFTIGVDIAKLKFDVASLINHKYKHKTFSNDSIGYTAFNAWILAQCGDGKPLICMEATGAYSLPLADFLVDQGYAVSLVNPAKIHSFAKSELSRAKTDKADAKLIARYALTMEPPSWSPPPANIRELHALVRRVELLLEMIRMEKNRHSTANPKIIQSINAVLETLNAELDATRKAIQDHIDNNPDLKQRSDLLSTIPGIGEASIAHLLIALSQHHGFTHAKQVVAFAGLAPSIWTMDRYNAYCQKRRCSIAQSFIHASPLCTTF
jgi:transposase